jgi:hypothetical protein
MSDQAPQHIKVDFFFFLVVAFSEGDLKVAIKPIVFNG